MTNSNSKKVYVPTLGKLKSKKTIKLESGKYAIRKILWQDFWQEYKSANNVSGQEEAIKCWTDIFIPAWEESDYFQCDSVEVLESLVNESDMTIDEAIERAAEIDERKASLNNRFSGLAPSKDMMNADNGEKVGVYETEVGVYETEEYDPLY